MSKLGFNIAYNFNCLAVLFLLLISCKSLSSQALDDKEFSLFIERVKTLQDTHPSKALKLLDSYKTRFDQLIIEDQLKYLNLEAEIYVDQAQYILAKTKASEGLELAKRLSSPSIIIAKLAYSRGFAIESLGDIEGATQDYLNGLAIAESLNDQKYVATGLTNLGAIYYLSEHYEKSLIILNDALSIANILDDDEMKGTVNLELGILYTYLREETKSMQFFQKSYEYFLKAGKTLSAFNSLRNIAINHASNERYEKAIALYKDIIAQTDTIGNNEIVYSAYSGMSWAYLKKDDPDPEAAYQYILIAGQYVSDMEQFGTEMSYAIDKAYILKELKRYDEALESILIAETLLSNQVDKIESVSILNITNLKAELYYAMGNFKLAYHYQEEFLDFALKNKAKNNMDIVEDIRMRYESEHADLQKIILEKKQSVQALELAEVSFESKNRKFLIIISALIALCLAWIVVIIYKGQKRLLYLSRIDVLTGLANRRRLMQLGERGVAQAIIKKEPYSILMIDIDDFKKINDKFGHQYGDTVLKVIASIGSVHMRKSDDFTRFGGEEFMALLPDSNAEQALDIAQKIRESICDYSWKVNDHENITVSIGVATLNHNETFSFDSLMKQADKLLYKAKQEGKNKVCANEC